MRKDKKRKGRGQKGDEREGKWMGRKERTGQF